MSTGTLVVLPTLSIAMIVPLMPVLFIIINALSPTASHICSEPSSKVNVRLSLAWTVVFSVKVTVYCGASLG